MGEKKPKVDLDAAPSSGAAAAPRRRQNKPSKVGESSARQMRTAGPSPIFDGTCDGLKGQGLVFDSASPRADRFTQVKRDIIEYIGKDYQNVGGVRWLLEHKKEKPISSPTSPGRNATDVDK
mmetsp:Transcript_51777/g.155378  ORF Transcript_51777/g.155378 Transcript_51777/m.155378 type:complete len:122 (-) Transcript_51777:1860-2225(-)